MMNPGVYAFKRGKTYLYVGSTRNLDKRPKKRDKGHLTRYSALIQADSVEKIPCESFERAYQVEEQMIRTHHPIFNKRTPKGKADLERTARIIRENW